ncbi:peptidyl-prolyl cis-trans isomerase FKBP53 isoform X2 [Lotus japonicus]|uniref:peptidyl-prolyl cis-trans isomerase FKBP53 isoform X2 n=1 Tax=Lotus japonicus TaxID=34305 RepID=UPI002586AFDC|nr:peptidyl-prolyl cis-trans isomerase FKBP53 isoform X2 [Lotus japonicus]
MGFWGIEVKPGKPYPYHSDNIPGKLHVTQATLGNGSSTEKSILQCASGHKSPVFLCSLLPEKIESCSLDLEFDEDDLVAFSVLGSRSIHLSGYFVADSPDEHLGDEYEYDSLGEDIAETESESDESTDYDSEDDYGDDFIDDSDFEMYPSSPVPNSGVIIEEIVDEPENENGDDSNKQLKKKEQVPRLKEKHSKGSQLQIVNKGENDLVLESEDEDGFPLSNAEKGKSESESQKAESEIKDQTKRTNKANKKAKDVDHSATLKRKVESVVEDEQLQDGKKKKKKNSKLKEQGKGEKAHASAKSNETNVNTPVEKHNEEAETTPDLNNVSHSKDGHDGKLSNNEVVEKKKNKKKKKTQESEGVATGNQVATPVEKQNLLTTEKKGKEQSEAKPSHIRTFANGLVIEELSMGKPDGKRATPGQKVSVKYIGKLKKNDKIFDSNVGKAPFKFRLGIGQVIKGWDVGVNGN